MTHTQTVNAAQAATIRQFQSIADEIGNTLTVYANPSEVSMVEIFPEGFGMTWIIDHEGNAFLQ